MQFSFLQSLLVSLLATTSAAAVLDRRSNGYDSVPAVALDESSGALSLQAGRRLNFCKNIDFHDCYTFVAEANICYYLPETWDNVCSSARALETMDCYVFDTQNCAGRSAGPLVGTKFRDLAEHGMDNIISSFLCQF